MNIEPWDPHAADEAERRAQYAFASAMAVELDPGTPPDPYELWRTDLLMTSPHAETKRWVARDGDVVVGYGQLDLERTGNNEHRAHFDINVAPTHRRRGLGRALLAPIAAAAGKDGRTTLAADAAQGTVGEKFLAAIGAEEVYLERRSRLVVADVDPVLVDQWIADAKVKAPEYSLLLFDGPVPDEHIHAVIDVHAAMNDAPREGLDLEDERDTPEHMRERERQVFDSGRRKMQVIARHDPTGEFAAFTTISWHPLLPEVAWQWGTAVRREHRGHAIGRWIKAANFLNLRERNPQARFVDTWNAGSNKWMLAINDDLGFKPYIWYTAWQANVDALRKTTGS